MRCGLEDTVRTKLSYTSAAAHTKLAFSVCDSKEELNAIFFAARSENGMGGAALQGSGTVGNLGSLLTSRPGDSSEEAGEKNILI